MTVTDAAAQAESWTASRHSYVHAYRKRSRANERTRTMRETRKIQRFKCTTANKQKPNTDKKVNRHDMTAVGALADVRSHRLCHRHNKDAISNALLFCTRGFHHFSFCTGSISLWTLHSLQTPHLSAVRKLCGCLSANRKMHSKGRFALE